MEDTMSLMSLILCDEESWSETGGRRVFLPSLRTHLEVPVSESPAGSTVAIFFFVLFSKGIVFCFFAFVPHTL